MALLIEAGQMTASGYVPHIPIYCLHPAGRPQPPFRLLPPAGTTTKSAGDIPGATGR